MKKVVVSAILAVALSGQAVAGFTQEQVIQAAQMITAFGNCSIVMENEKDFMTSEYLKNKAIDVSIMVEDNASPKQQKQVLMVAKQFTNNFWQHDEKTLFTLCDELANTN